MLNLSKSTAHKFIHHSMKIVCESAPEWIKFPSDMNELQQSFEQTYRFPGVIGAIDCTHVKIDSIGGNQPEVFRNRKGFFSINIQAVCGPDLRFYDVVARWPGSTHDSRIFENSHLNTTLELSNTSGHLLGDSGYALKTYLMTPFQEPSNHEQKRYNKIHSQTRMFIEKAFGVLKLRFPILKHGLRLLEAQDNCNLILSAFVLHNRYIQFKREAADSMLENPIEEGNLEANMFNDAGGQEDESQEGSKKRLLIARNLLA